MLIQKAAKCDLPDGPIEARLPYQESNMRYQKRICNCYGNRDFKPMVLQEYNYSDKPDFKIKIIQEYTNFVQRYIDKGWKPYIITFMFTNLPGGMEAILSQMEDEVMRVYSTFITRVVRNPRSALFKDALPILLGCPDRPVRKNKKSTVDDVKINDGLHVHGILIVPKQSRLSHGAKKHFRLNERFYVNEHHRIERIHLKRIKFTPEEATKYALKGLKRGWVNYERIIVLPRAKSELSGQRSAA
jgi:hypothetical protein